MKELLVVYYNQIKVAVLLIRNFLVAHYNQIKIVILLIASFIILTAMLDERMSAVLLSSALVLIFLALGLQIYVSYLALTLQDLENSYKYVHSAIHSNRDAYHYLELCISEEKEFSQDLFKEYMTSSLTAMAVAFSITTRKKCRTCVKLLAQEEGKLCLETLARDRESTKEYRYVDEKPSIFLDLNNDNIENQHIANAILAGKKPYYICNDLRLSRRVDYFKSIAENRYRKEHAARKDWNLPYLSTIFSPIRYLQSLDEYGSLGLQTPEQNPSKIYYGFFAVDSRDINVFSELEHQMTASFADSLFPVLSIYQKLQQDLSTTIMEL